MKTGAVSYRTSPGRRLLPKDIGGRKIVGLSFPTNNNLGVGLEPSILHVLPPGQNVSLLTKPPEEDSPDVGLYLVSVYIAGMNEFRQWAKGIDPGKIVVGGYHPTMFPEKFLDYAGKVVVGPCNDIWATLAQSGVAYQLSRYDEANSIGLNIHYDTMEPLVDPDESAKLFEDQLRKPNNARFIGGQFVPEGAVTAGVVTDRIIPGILDPVYPFLPRLDLHDMRTNYQVGPEMKPGDLYTSINTSYGCKYRCDFCCTPVMYGRGLASKPLAAVEREVEVLQKHRPDFLFVRDENPTLLPDFASRMALIARTGARIDMFASANTLTDDVVDTLSRNNVYMVCLGLEDPTVRYAKNKHLEGAVARLKRRGILTYLSFIVDPLKVVGAERGAAFYNLLMERFRALKPEMVCGNFLMPFPGTPMWDRYYHLVTEADFDQYDSKTPFLIKNPVAEAKMRYFMFYYQWLYYSSAFYRDNVRRFDVDDTLHLRFLQLREKFEGEMSEIRMVRP